MIAVQPLVACLLAVPLHAQDRSPGWNQARANAAGTGAVDYSAPESAPAERWRLELGALVAEPVSWMGVLYVATAGQRGRDLHAIDIETGAVLCSASLGRGETVRLAAWQGTILVVEPDGLQTFVHRGDSLSKGKRVRGAFPYAPCVVAGAAIFAGPEELTVVDVVRGSVLVRVEIALAGRPAIVADEGGNGRLAAQRLVEVGVGKKRVDLVTLAVEDLGTRKPSFGEPVTLEVCGVVPTRTDDSGAFTAHLGLDGQGNEAWYLHAVDPPQMRSGVELPGVLARDVYAGIRTSPFASAPALGAGSLVGYNASDSVSAQSLEGVTDSLANGVLPTGARPGAVTVAGGVALLGNWAVECGTWRVLWCLPELHPAGPLLPVAPDRLVAWTDEGLLLCLGSAVEAVARDATETAVEREPRAALRPDAGAGLVLAEGRFVTGTLEDLGSGVCVTPEGGAAEEFTDAEIAWVEDGDGSVLMGDEHPVLVAWRDALDRELAAALVPHFEGYAEVGMLDDCRRLLDEMRARGLAGTRLDELDASLVGKTQNGAANAPQKRERVAREERATRESFLAELLEGATWCELRDLPNAATALLAHADRILPDSDEVLRRADALVPRGFPWAKEADAARLWMRWAEEILPAGATFLDPGSPEWTELAGTVWEKDTYGFETRNLHFFTKCDDPAVIGRCLRNGEGVVRVLQELIGPPPGEGSAERLHVRVHATREAYLREEDPETGGAPVDTLGYYMPGQRVSRFFVSGQESPDPLGRELHRVLVHEMTHQYLTERWITKEQHLPVLYAKPGFWIVEGFATFIGDQGVELGRRQGLDDPTVRSVDAMTQIAEAGMSIDTAELIDTTWAGFHEISNELAATIQLRNKLRRLPLSKINFFYEQSGALVFFLMNRCGDEGRAALLEYMRDYYEMRSKKKGWKKLGFESAEELAKAFEEFLDEVRG